MTARRARAREPKAAASSAQLPRRQPQRIARELASAEVAVHADLRLLARLLSVLCQSSSSSFPAVPSADADGLPFVPSLERRAEQLRTWLGSSAPPGLDHVAQKPSDAYLAWRSSWIQQGFQADVTDLERTAAWNLLSPNPQGLTNDDIMRWDALERERTNMLDHAERLELTAWSRFVAACHDPAVPAEDKADLADDYERAALAARDAQARLINARIRQREASLDAQRSQLVQEASQDWSQDARVQGLDAVRRERAPYVQQLECLERLVVSVPALRALHRRMEADDRVVLRWSRRLAAASGDP